MIIHNLTGNFQESEKGLSITNSPDSNGPKVRVLRVAIARELGSEVPERAKVVRLKRKDGSDGILMMFPENKPDNRHFVIGGFSYWEHRSDVEINKEDTTGKILEESHGYGAWGSGVCFFAILSEGERIVSTRHDEYRKVIWAEGREVKEARMADDEYLQLVGLEDCQTEEL